MFACGKRCMWSQTCLSVISMSTNSALTCLPVIRGHLEWKTQYSDTHFMLCCAQSRWMCDTRYGCEETYISRGDCIHITHITHSVTWHMTHKEISVIIASNTKKHCKTQRAVIVAKRRERYVWCGFFCGWVPMSPFPLIFSEGGDWAKVRKCSFLYTHQYIII
jgi:hypothetical protein